MLHRILPFLMLTITAVPANSQDSTELEVLESLVLKNTSKIYYSHLNRDTVASYSYLVLFDETSRLDTIVLSSMPGGSELPKESVARLKAAYQNLDTLGLDLVNAALFVPVLILPMEVYYRVIFTERSRAEAFAGWQNVFSVLNPELLRNKHLKYAKPVFVSVSGGHEELGGSGVPSITPLAKPPFKQ